MSGYCKVFYGYIGEEAKEIYEYLTELDTPTYTYIPFESGKKRYKNEIVMRGTQKLEFRYIKTVDKGAVWCCIVNDKFVDFKVCYQSPQIKSIELEESDECKVDCGRDYCIGDHPAGIRIIAVHPESS